jgi:hypothetical protein
MRFPERSSAHAARAFRIRHAPGCWASLYSPKHRGCIDSDGTGSEIRLDRVSAADAVALEGPRGPLRSPRRLRRLLVHVVPAAPVRMVAGEGREESACVPQGGGAGTGAGDARLRREAADRLVRLRAAGALLRAPAVAVASTRRRPAGLVDHMLLRGARLAAPRAQRAPPRGRLRLREAAGSDHPGGISDRSAEGLPGGLGVRRTPDGLRRRRVPGGGAPFPVAGHHAPASLE